MHMPVLRSLQLTVAAALAAALGSSPLGAQTVDGALRAQVVDSAAKLIEANFVFPELARRVAARLRDARARSAYARDTTADAFATALTRDVRAVTSDLHLGFMSPEMARARGAMPGRGPVDSSALRTRAERERRRNYYFRALETLPGNVGYLRLDQFAFPDAARETAAAMMRVLANADAVILDLRTNPGGVEGLNQFLSSYFFDGREPVVLYTRYHRIGDSTATIRVLPELPGPRLPSTPLYILVGPRTGSSAENMSYSLQALKRATIVGEPTAGGANTSGAFRLPGGFVLQVPVARVINPVTGTNWEGRGVQPDVAASAAAARDTAYALALRALLERARDDDARRELRQALDELSARAPSVAAEPAEPRPRAMPAPAAPGGAGAAGAPGAPARNMGFGLVPHPDGRLTVTAVAPGSSAEREGLREGDELVEFGGTPAASMSPSVMRAAAARGTSVRVVVRREGRRLELDVLPHAAP